MPTRSLLSAAVLAVLAAAPAAAQTPRDVADLAGARAAGAETQMVARGYQLVRNTATEDTRWNFWWSALQQQCVSVAVSDGRYQTLNVVPRENCTAGTAGADAAPPPPMADAGGETLALVCYGEGNRPSVATRTAYEWDSQRHRYHPTTRVESSTEDFESDVQVELYGDHGRIHLERLVPPIHSGATNGWWDLQDLVVTPERITARYRLNGLNHPRLAIDRRTGHISIDAITDFSGMCDAGSGGRNRF